MTYDTEKWGGYADEMAMATHITENKLDLKLLAKEEPVDFSDDPDGRMFILVFQKTLKGRCKTSSWLVKRAGQLKDQGNSFYTTKALLTNMPGEMASSSPRQQLIWKAIASYVKGIDCLRLAQQDESEDAEQNNEKICFLQSRLHSNLAAAYLELGSDTHAAALAAIDEALKLDPDWEKAKERKSKIVLAMEQERDSMSS